MNNSHKHDWGWMFASVLLVATVLIIVRYASGILQTGFVLDEQYITVPINQLIEQGWSVQTAIDFEETKGPAMIWLYAVLGDLFGGSLNTLRLISVLCSIACMGVLSYIASLCGVRRASHLMISIGWLLLPYSLVFSEIVMGEVSFVLLELCAVAVFLRHREYYGVLAPICFGVLIAIALHSRIHVVAVVAAVCFLSFLRDGFRSWPWWVAGFCAGLLRIPLWIRWDGLVSPKYQNLHGLGFRLESLSYLAAALAPIVGVFAICAWKQKASRKWLALASVIGFFLVIVAMPSLHIPETINYDSPNDRFQGIVGTAIQMVSGDQAVQKLLLALLAAVGLAGLVGLHRMPTKSVTSQLTCFTLTFGWLLYAFTQGFVFDRFLMVWAFLLPIVWWTQLTRPLFILQSVAMLIIALRLTVVWL